jgi:hypothetical protein
MAEGILDARDSLQRCLQAKVGGKGEEGVKDLLGYIDTGLQEVKEEQDALRGYVEDIRAVQETFGSENWTSKGSEKTISTLVQTILC